jgi:hypothetical protein
MYNILSIGRANVFVMPCLILSTSKKVMIVLSFWEVGANSSQWGGGGGWIVPMEVPFI